MIASLRQRPPLRRESEYEGAGSAAGGDSVDRKFVSIEGVGMHFGEGANAFEALRGIDLSIRRGECVAIIGHSGCGKSTLLNLIAGLTLPSRGGLICDGREIAGPGPERAVVFQSHSLLPWLSCLGNVQLAVDRVFAKERRAQRQARALAALELVGLAHAAQKRPHEISGGMKQRVGIARALAMEPKVLLMDEPFGALDALTRASLQDSVMRLHAQLGMTIVLITHDVDEAVLLADRVVMMSNGPAATIAQVLEVTLPRPRERLALAEDQNFHHLRREVLAFLHDKAV
jgi:nitrate/nitrite transport system ATP-binding protein